MKTITHISRRFPVALFLFSPSTAPIIAHLFYFVNPKISLNLFNFFSKTC